MPFLLLALLGNGLLAPHFILFFLGHGQKPKFWHFWMTKCPTRLLAFRFSCSTTGLAFSSEMPEKASLRWAISAMVVTKFCSKFFTQISEHIIVYLRLHWTDHSDLAFTGKISSSCRTLVWMMSILCKGENVRSGTKGNIHHSCYGRHRHQWFYWLPFSF